MSTTKKKPIHVKIISDNKVELSGKGTFEIKETIKELAKALELKYRFDDEREVWVIEGDKVLEFVSELQKESLGKVEVIIEKVEEEDKSRHIKPQIIYEEKLLEKVTEYLGFDINTVGVLYGPPMAGKTRFSIALAKEVKEVLGLKPLFLVTEPNWLFRHKGKSFMEYVSELFGRDSVKYCKTTHELLTFLRKGIESNAFIVVDSIGAISQRFLAKYIIERGEVEAIVATPRVVPFVNALTYYIANECLEKGATALLIAHEQQLINRNFFTEDTKPSFGSRAIHSCTYIWRMFRDREGNTKIKCVVHRLDKSYEGREIEVKL